MDDRGEAVGSDAQALRSALRRVPIRRRAAGHREHLRVRPARERRAAEHRHAVRRSWPCFSGVSSTKPMQAIGVAEAVERLERVAVAREDQQRRRPTATRCSRRASARCRRRLRRPANVTARATSSHCAGVSSGNIGSDSTSFAARSAVRKLRRAGSPRSANAGSRCTGVG